MSFGPEPAKAVPPLTVRVARASSPRGTTAMWIRDRLESPWDNEDFADRYPRDGRPGLSPAQLATVCVLQYVLDLSDRQVAEAVRCDFRIDFDRRQVTCPQGQVSKGRHGPYPTSSPTAAPLIVARFTKAQCQPCPVRSKCTTSRDSARNIGFPREYSSTCKSRPEPNSRAPPGSRGMPCVRESRAPSANSRTGTACGNAATTASARPTSSTYSPPSP